jgi:hypothetical protein
VGATPIALPGSACADSIFVSGATQVGVTFSGVVSDVQGNIPAIAVGTVVSGQFVYDLDVMLPGTGNPPMTEFLMTAGDITFSQADVLESRLQEFAGTFGFSAEASLRGRPELGDLSDGVLFSMFAEFEDFNFGLRGVTTDALARGRLTSLHFKDASVTTPEAPTLFMVSPLLYVLARHLRKQARARTV